jgi:molybdopterin-guanine dinucleotide biosynthesis protein A
MINAILEDAGPLSVILSALVLCKSRFLFVCTCDSEMPSCEVISYFADIAKETQASAVASSDKNFIYPFNAFYSKDIVEELTIFLLKGGRKIQDFLEQIKCIIYPQKEIERKFKKFKLKKQSYTSSDVKDKKRT